jgi:succinylglutamate desuccinylase
MLIVVGSIHGNEPAGSRALDQIARQLEADGASGSLVRGDLLALVGNVTALEAGARFIDEDLNRQWSAEGIESLRKRRDSELVTSEERERKALVEEIERGFAEARGPVVLLDLHTTSGDGKPFAVFADTLRSRRFARRFPVPAVLGLEEQLESTLADYVGHLGHVAVAFEGGQHQDPRSLENLTAVVAIALGELAMVDQRKFGIEERRRNLAKATRGVPGILEVVYRHGIVPEDGFRMRPGYRSFEPVVEGQAIADDAEGQVAVPENGFLLMPLYQRLGDDGFFVVRRVLGFWLGLSAVLRLLRAGSIAHWLPGVSRIPGEPCALRVDRNIARWYSLRVLHLLGFRKVSEEGAALIVERRLHDLV